MLRASNCSAWKLTEQFRNGNRFQVYYRLCKLPRPFLGQVEYRPSRNVCTVRVTTPEGKIVFKDKCKCLQTGKRRIDNWIEGKEGWR